MGITIVQKSDLSRRRPRATKALILAGGAVTGGSFMAGGLKALGDYLPGRGVCDFDIFVGISAGSLLAAPLMGGIPPSSILKSLDGTSRHFTPLNAWHYYRPNFSELVARPLKFMINLAGWLPGGLMRLADRYPEWSHGILEAIWRFATHPSIGTYEEMMEPILMAIGGGDFPSLLSVLPSGVFDNRPIELYIRQNIERNGLTNDFREARRLSGKRLYICAMRLDGARRVIFGPDEDHSLTISQAIQASTAMPGFYRPAHIGGVDYVDGGVQETANIDIAVEKGAELVVCYNPFRPYDPEAFVAGFRKEAKSRRTLAGRGLMAVLNQILRAFFHARLTVALDHFRSSPRFKGDIILIEPRADDLDFFALNPLSLSNKVKASRMGFTSVRNSIEKHYDKIAAILAACGIAMNRAPVEDAFRKLALPETGEGEARRLLEGRAKELEKTKGPGKTKGRRRGAGR